MVSGGFLQLAEPIGRQLGFHEVHANDLLVTAGKLTGTCGPLIVDGQEKMRFVKEKLLEKADSDGVLIVGDGANDSMMMGLGDLAFGYYPKQALVPFLNGGVYCGDHGLILAAMT